MTSEKLLWTTRHAGRLLGDLDTAQGLRTDQLVATVARSSKKDALKEMGVPQRSASRWEALSEIPLDRFEAYVLTERDAGASIIAREAEARAGELLKEMKLREMDRGGGGRGTGSPKREPISPLREMGRRAPWRASCAGTGRWHDGWGSARRGERSDAGGAARRGGEVQPMTLVDWAIRGLKTMDPNEPAPLAVAVQLGKHGRPADAPRDENGAFLPAEPKGSDDNLRDIGRGRDYQVARLRRDRPDLADRVDSGEMSANRAAIEAGFRHERTRVQQAQGRRFGGPPTAPRVSRGWRADCEGSRLRVARRSAIGYKR